MELISATVQSFSLLGINYKCYQSSRGTMCGKCGEPLGFPIALGLCCDNCDSFVDSIQRMIVKEERVSSTKVIRAFNKHKRLNA